MKVGDLVKAPWLMDHDGFVGIIVSKLDDKTFVVSFGAGGVRVVFSHLVEVLNESR